MQKFKYIAAVICSICIIGGNPAYVAQAEATGTPVMAGEEQLYIRNNFDESLVPEGFSNGTMQFQGAGISVLQSEDEQTTLVYMTDENGENGAFYQYQTDGETYSFLKYIQVKNGDRTLTVTEPDEVIIPDGYSETSLAIDGQSVKAWQLAGGDSEFYLVYGTNQDGSEGLWHYDSSDGSFMRFVETQAPMQEDTVTASEQVEILENRLDTVQSEYENNQDMLFKIMCGLMALSGVLLLIIIHMLFKISGLKKQVRKGRAVKEQPVVPAEKQKEKPRKEKKRKRRRRSDDDDDIPYVEDLDDFDDLTEELLEDPEEPSAKGIRDFHEIKVDLDTEAEAAKQDHGFRVLKKQSEEPLEEDFLDDDEEFTEELTEIKPEEEPEKNNMPDEEIEDYDDFELEILDLDEEE